jgi:carbonic anhydrase
MKVSQVVDEVTTANDSYAADFGEKGELPIPPGRQFAILTFMGARLAPASVLVRPFRLLINT